MLYADFTKSYFIEQKTPNPNGQTIFDLSIGQLEVNFKRSEEFAKCGLAHVMRCRENLCTISRKNPQ